MPRVQGLRLKVSVVSLYLPPSPGQLVQLAAFYVLGGSGRGWPFHHKEHFQAELRVRISSATFIKLIEKKNVFNPVYPPCSHFFQVVLPQVHLLTKGCTPFPTRFCTWQPGFNMSLVQIWEVSPLVEPSEALPFRGFPVPPVCLYEDPILKRAKTNPAVWWLNSDHDVIAISSARNRRQHSKKSTYMNYKDRL